ncbi:MAG: YicC family protein [Oscillospiraceae bacterium]|nr:YicC family protein [Oscillospiraceae bacterium]
MLRSMTGYGRRESVTDGKKILAEIKSVNHRYSDYNIKVQRHLGFLEDKIRKHVSQFITRGKVDVYVNVENYETADKEISLNKAVAVNYIDVLKELRDEFGLKDDISVMTVARNSELFKTDRVEEDEDALWESVKNVLDEALGDFIAMRSREGERIQEDLCNRIKYMGTLVKTVDERSPQTVKEYSDRLYEKIKEVLDGHEIDEARVLTEVAIYADKVAVNEETVRLGSHFAEFDEIINSGEPAGRKLDFLIQEINREVNTIGSKASDIEIAKTVVTLKGEIEKLREQIQNIE